MDRNTILAIVLSLVVLLGWMYFTSPKKGGRTPVPTPRVTATAQPAPAVGQPGAPAVSAVADGTEVAGVAGTGVVAAAAAQPVLGAQEFAVLSNGLVSYTFSSYGGGIHDIVLHRTPEVQRGPITSLRAAGAAGRVPFVFEKLGAVPLNIYELGIAELTQSALAYTGMIGGGVHVTKRYELEGYLVRGTISVRNTGAQALALANQFGIWLGSIERESAKPDKNAPRSVDVHRLKPDGSSGPLERKNAGKDGLIPGPVEWLAVRNKYFAHLLVPDAPALSATIMSYGPKEDKNIAAYATFAANDVPPGGTYTWRATLYAGPKSHDQLAALGKLIGRGSEYTKLLNLGMFWFLALPILVYGLKGLMKIVGSYGLAIIILTTIIKIITWPLTTKSFRSMKEMQRIQPELKALQEKHKGDPRQLQQETMLLYRKHGVNPFGGCLPMLLQIPVFFALYAALNNAIELWGASFLWIKDLSQPDTVATIPFSIPFLGNGVNPLAIVMGAAMIGQQMMSPSTGDKSQQQMMYLMPVIFMVMFYNMPSGLVLYWLVNQLLTMAQMGYLNYLKKG
ncbi:membrane protein insertase YidC [bacterium]|nr:membrane protein insertase YidC [bacterium]